MQHVIFNTTNICSATWLEREEIRQIHLKIIALLMFI